VHPVKQLASSTVGSYGQYHEDNRVVKNKTSGPGGAPKRKSSDFSVVADATEHAKISKDASHAPLELRELEKHKAAVLPVDYAHKSKTSETYDYAYSAYRDKGTSVQLDFQLRKASGENQDPSNRIYRKEKYGTSEYPVMAMGSAVYSTQTVNPVVGREGSGTKPKGTRLERAIRDLQKIVAEYRPPIIDINEVDPNGQAAVKRRLPQEVKQKLAKVARLSANQGKIQEHELMDRLMGIVGHLVQRRTLKRNMKEMVESGLSAKLEKADRFQRIKMEINEMIKTRVAAKSKVKI
jgi:ubinuclein